MSLTPSTMLELGTTAPDFSLVSPSGEMYTLAEHKIDKGLLIVFICNHCPYVIHIRKSLADKARQYQEKDITVVAINSNDFSAYPDDNPEKMALMAKECGFSFPYLVDESQDVAKLYRAACTPDFFLFDGDKKLVYRGQFDGARPGNNVPISGEDLSSAVQNILNQTPSLDEQRPSMGCNIKWKPGHEPDYF